MTSVSENFLAETIDDIESSYEFLLAYAAQGREFENTAGGSGPSVREFLTKMEKGLGNIVYARAEKIESLNLEVGPFTALEEFKGILAEDVDPALKAVRLVLSVPSISSQLVDNLNASAHLRCLLTDIFVIDEAIKAHQ